MTVDRRWFIGLIVALVVSLGANLVVAGIVVAHRWVPPPPPPFALGGPSATEGLFGQLSPEGRDVVRETMRATRKELRDEFLALRESRKQVKALLEADPLDQAALAAALDHMNAQNAAIQARYQRAFVEVASKLSVEDRRRFKPSRADDGRPPRPEGAEHGGPPGGPMLDGPMPDDMPPPRP
ncbi:periplasmic heavy metal sensor [Zavarzinia sp.]|uniref:periplasmic heavy metal sensor n=1 Tax=Zavarzinia sp. TaxID=2027920 RepID=UPI0035685458